ncbi:MAG TPA: Xaa-Pro peptidase family protein [Candidatus Dormibacteraeota bacterium]|jgi:Xaa-Pro dipeptidase
MRERDDLPFSMAEYHTRLTETRRRMAENGWDLFLCTTPENMYYLTGFNSRGYYSYQCLFVPLEGEPFMVTRHLDAANVEHQTWMERGYDYRDEDDPIALTAHALGERGFESATIGVELSSWFLTAATDLLLRAAVPTVRFQDGSALIEQQRMIKSNAEAEYIKRAAECISAGMDAAIDATREGALDREIAAAGYHARILAGSEYVASPMYVQTGPGSAIAHNNWDGRRLEKGDLVFYEMGASFKRYHAAIMRTAVIGPPSDMAKRADAATREGLEAALALMRPGATADEVDRAYREVMVKRGFEEYIGLRLGYHIGIGYPPTWVGRGTFSLNTGAQDRLAAGMVFHVIPSVRIPGLGGIGNSETVLVTERDAEVLTNFDSRLFVR